MAAAFIHTGAPSVAGDGMPGAPSAPPLFYDMPAVDNRDPDTAIARFGRDAAPWIDQAIAAMQSAHGAHALASQIVLVPGDGGDQLLLLTWHEAGQSTVEVHRVSDTDEAMPHLTLLRRVDDAYRQHIQVVTDALFPGAPPIAAVAVQPRVGNRCDDALRLIQLTGDTVDVTPDWTGLPVRNLLDLDGDGVLEVVMSGGLSPTCRIELGELPVVLRPAEDRFVFACTDYPDAFARWLDLQVGWVTEDVPLPLVDVYRSSREALILAQTGRVDQGLAPLQGSYARMSDEGEAALEAHSWLREIAYPDHGWRMPLEALLERAQSLPPSGCPVTEAYRTIWAEWEAADELMETGR